MLYASCVRNEWVYYSIKQMNVKALDRISFLGYYHGVAEMVEW